MIHLFHNTYITLDNYIDHNANRMVISHAHGFPMLGVLKDAARGELYTYGITIEEALKNINLSDVVALFEYCVDKNIAYPDTKLIIYCDNDSYRLLLANWHKIMFLNIDANSSFRIVQTNLARLGITGKKTYTNSPSKFINAIPTKEEYTTIFNSVTIDTATIASLLEKTAEDKNLEYLMASYLYNGSFKEQLKKPIKIFISKLIHSLFGDIWGSTVFGPSMLRIKDREIFGITTGGIDNILSIADDPLWNGGFEKICRQESLDLSELTKEEQVNALGIMNLILYFYTRGVKKIEQKLLTETLVDMRKANLPRFDRFNLYYNILANTPGTLTDSDIDTIIESELDYDFHLFTLSSVSHRDTLNEYMLEYVYELVRNNQKDQLAPYLLR